MPIDPVQSAIPDEDSPIVHFSGDGEDHEELTLVEQGMEQAETERRESVIDAYERAALESDDQDASLDDIDYALGDPSLPPELAAMHDGLPVGDDEEEDDSLA